MNIQESINQINATVRAMCDSGKPDPKVLAVAVEANQLYLEWLDELLDGVKVCTAVVVRVAGETIKFQSIEDVAAWITSSK